jgi:hypothetical protein
MNVKAIYIDGLHIDDQITYTNEEIDGIFRDYEAKVWKKEQCKADLQGWLKNEF